MNSRTEFLQVRKAGRAKAGRYVILSTLEDPALIAIRVGFITTRKVGKAHERNRLRRKFRRFVQLYAENFAESHRYLVTIARSGSAEASHEALEQDWLRQAKRLGLFRKGEVES